VAPRGAESSSHGLGLVVEHSFPYTSGKEP